MLTHKLLLAGAIVAGATVNAAEYDSILKHVHGRMPDVALESTMETYYGQHYLIPSLSSHFGLTEASVSTILATRDYGICTFDGYFETDGIAVGSDVFTVGSFTRSSYADDVRDEYFVCRQNKDDDWELWISGTCGQRTYREQGTVNVVVPSVRKATGGQNCKVRVHREQTSSVQHVPGVTVGEISVGSETYITRGTTYRYEIDCPEEAKR